MSLGDCFSLFQSGSIFYVIKPHKNVNFYQKSGIIVTYNLGGRDGYS